MRSLLLAAALVVTLAGCPGTSTVDGGMDVPSTLDAPALDAPALDVPGLDTPAAPDTPEGLDAPTTDAPRVADGVNCAGTPCAVGEVCCDGEGIDCTTLAGCPGVVYACDGPEDCDGSSCCLGSAGSACGTCTGSTRYCHTEADCSTGETCCPNGGAVPAGGFMHCTTLEPGTSCPLPP